MFLRWHGHNVDPEVGGSGEPVVERGQRRVQVPGEGDVNGVGDGHVVSKRPGFVDQWLDRGALDCEREETVEGLADAAVAEVSAGDGSAQDACGLDVEVFGDPDLDRVGEFSLESPSGPGAERDLDRG